MGYWDDLFQYVWSGFCCVSFVHLLLKDEKRKEDFGLRFSVSIIGYVALSSMLSVLALIMKSDNYHYITHTIVMLAVFVLVAICYEIERINVIFSVYLSIVFLQTVRLGVNFINALLKWNGILMEYQKGIRYLIFILAFSILYCVLRFVALKNVKLNMNSSSKKQVALFVGTGSVVMLLSIFNRIIEEYSLLYYLIFIFCQIACCMLIILIQTTFAEKLNLEIEKAVVEQLSERSNEQYYNLKENMEIINIKCHDMRHSIAEHVQIDKEEISKLIDDYDAYIHSGNAALDTVLTDMSLRCRVRNILFTCVADGKLLSFMTSNDICSLFGNAIENAMEAELQFAPEMRFISTTVKRVNGFVSIHIENYFAGQLHFENGLPITSKSDEVYHGFGMKSIKRIVQKYGGYMSITMEDDMFQLDCLFEK